MSEGAEHEVMRLDLNDYKLPLEKRKRKWGVQNNSIRKDGGTSKNTQKVELR